MGILFTDDPGWIVDPTNWWMALIAVVVAGLIYYQMRNNLS